MQTLREAKEYTIKMLSQQWVQWIHNGTKPATSSAEKTNNAIIGAVSSHCAMCLNLNGCCFVKDKCPPKPLHPKCHCYTIDMPTINADAQCPIEKFTKYVFVPSDISDKYQLFALWGYDIMDAEYLQKEFERQALIAYSTGNYELGLLNEYGQRIYVNIKLKNKTINAEISCLSVWMVYPNGKIVLVTPYGGKKR